MESAYMVKNGKEPDFTNHAKIRDDEPFIDVLDYIFLNKGSWNVSSVDPIVLRDEIGGPLPNDDEPSDHVAIAADLTTV